jgi:hypothetical protein
MFTFIFILKRFYLQKYSHSFTMGRGWALPRKGEGHKKPTLRQPSVSIDKCGGFGFLFVLSCPLFLALNLNMVQAVNELISCLPR